MQRDVFISYASSDSAIAESICAMLEKRGLCCWIAPRNIIPGVHWGEAIIEGINSSKTMLVIFSTAANKSPQVLREVERAVSKGLLVIPFRIEAILPSKAMEYFLSSPHWFNAINPPIEEHVKRLGDLLEALVVRKEDASDSPETPQIESEQSQTSQRLEATKPKAAPAPPTPSEIVSKKCDELTIRIKEIAQIGKNVSEEFETKEKAKPLTQHFLNFAAGVDQHSFSICLLGSSTDLSKKVLASVLSDQAMQILAQIPASVDFLEIHLAKKLSLQTTVSGAKEFRDVDEFFGSLKKLPVVEELSLGLTGLEDALGTRIYFPCKIAALGKRTELLTRLVTRTSLLVFIGDEDLRLTDEDRSAVIDVCHLVDAVWPIVVCKKAKTTKSNQGWWEQDDLFGESASFQAEILSDSNIKQEVLKGLFTTALKRSLVLHHHSRRLWHSALMVAKAVQQRIAKVSKRQALNRRQLSSLDEIRRNLGADSPGFPIAQFCKNEILNLRKSIEAANASLWLAHAPMTEAVKRASRALVPGSLESASTDGAQQVLIKKKFLEELMAELVEAINYNMQTNLKLLNDGLVLLKNQLKERLSSTFQVVPSIDVSMPAAQQILSAARPKKIIDGEFRPHGGKTKGVDLKEELEHVKLSVAWEAERFARDYQKGIVSEIENCLETFQSVVMDKIGQVVSGGSPMTSDQYKGKRTQFDALATELDAALAELKEREDRALKLQQTSAEMESACRQVLLEAFSLSKNV